MYHRHTLKVDFTSGIGIGSLDVIRIEITHLSCFYHFVVKYAGLGNTLKKSFL